MGSTLFSKRYTAPAGRNRKKRQIWGQGHMTLGTSSICKRCKKEVPNTYVRFDKNMEIVCLDCYNHHNPGPAKTADKKVVVKPTIKMAPKAKPSNPGVPSDRIPYSCMKCGYKFSFKKISNHDEKCPYCGSTQVASVQKK